MADAEKKENEEKKKDKKKSKKKIIVIVIIVAVILIACSVVGYFVYKYNNSTGTDWGDAYYGQLIEIQNCLDTISDESMDSPDNTAYYSGIVELATDINVQFFDLNNDDIPEMIATYKDPKMDNKEKTTIYTYDATNSDIPVTYHVTAGVIELLYNIETQEYGYYVKTGSDEGVLRYTTIEDAMQDIYSNAYTFSNNEGEITSNLDVADGEIPTISKRDETFITIGEIDEEKISITKDITEDEIRKSVRENIRNVENIDQTVTEEVKTETDTKLQELQSTKDKIAQLEEEAKQKAEEEAQKAAEVAAAEAEEKAKEEAEGLKAGKYTLKYGKYYNGSYFYYGTDSTPGTATITIKSDGTYTFKSSFGDSESGTYTVDSTSMQGSWYAGWYEIKFSSGMTLGIHEDNTFEELAGAGAKYTYQGN